MIFIGALLAIFAAVSVAWPLLRSGSDAPERSEAALAIYVDQLAEVDRDASRGQISNADAEAARTEIKRRMLAASRTTSAENQNSGGLALVLLAVLVPLGGLGIYAYKGSPDLPSQPFAERAQERDDAGQLQTLVSRLRTQLEGDAAGGETRGWELLATTYMNMGRAADAAYAFEQIVDRDDATSATWSQFAEALIAAESGVVTPKALGAIEAALAMDPGNPAGTYYNALAMEQSGQSAQARQSLIDRINQEAGYQPWMDTFAAEANRLGQTLNVDPYVLSFAPAAGPSREDIEAAQDLSAEDQQKFIAGMVDRLANRLEEDPNDLQGWMQLARAYMVLDRPEDALAALRSAAPIAAKLPEDDPLRRAIEAGIAQLDN